MFAILSRLEPTTKCDLMTKLKLYNGEEVVEKGRTKKIDVQELREDDQARRHERHLDPLHHEGARQCAVRQHRRQLHQPDQRARGADQHGARRPTSPTTRASSYLEFLQDTLHKEYLEILEKEITKAFVYSYQEQAEALFQNYLDHAEAFVNKTQGQGPQHRARSCSPTKASSSRSRSRSRSSDRPPRASARR